MNVRAFHCKLYIGILIAVWMGRGSQHLLSQELHYRVQLRMSCRVRETSVELCIVWIGACKWLKNVIYKLGRGGQHRLGL